MRHFGYFAALLYVCVIGSYNAIEAHRHTHELACYLNAEDLCSHHEGHPHDH